MAEIVVSFALERLHNLASEEAKLLHGVSFQVEQLRVEFKRMQCFLRDADARQSESETIHNWVIEIKDIAYDSQDVIETFVLKVASRRTSTSVHSFLKRCVCMFSEGRELHKVGQDIQTIKTRISELTTSLQTYGIRAIREGEEGSSSSAFERQQYGLRRSYSHVVEKDFVGLEEDVETLVGVLVSEDRDCFYQTLSICGMGGLGKTTIAQKVYNDPKVKRHFDGFAWVCVSQQWQTRDILQGILTKLIPHEMDRIMLIREEGLMRLLLQVQQSRKCLVVLDDIWSEAAWDCIRHAFPIGTMGGKVLITTRNKEVAMHVDPRGFVHEPRLLSDDESWELLQRKSFSKSDGKEPTDDRNMEELGRKMVKHCGGLPLAVIVLGGILVTKRTQREWEMVHRNISSYIRRGKGIGHQNGVSQVLALSYSNLPYQLKSCFLYLGNFPEDSEIEADKLYQMWIAEGLVALDDQAEADTLMDVAECYLGELAHRYMVRVEVDAFSGRFKSCRLHDLLRDLCLLKGKEENFVSVIDFRHKNEEQVECSYSSLESKVRRLAIHLDEDLRGFPLKKRAAQHLRSLSFFVPNKYHCVPLPGKFYFRHFRVLRVLDLSRIQFCKKLAKAIGKLIQLRYLSLQNSGFRKLPSSIGNLGCLQTLDLRKHDQFRVFGTIPNVLWKMKSLRHLYLHDCIRTKHGLRLDGLSKLETLETFTTSLFDVEDLFMLTNLWKLKAHVKVEASGVLVAIIDYLNIRAIQLQHSSFHIEYNFCHEEDLNLLRQLLECRRLNTLHLGGVIRGKLPEQNHFSPSLTMLEFSGSELKEDPMATLEKLPNLRSLALSSNAFVGAKMVCSKFGFPQLKSLKLGKLSNLEDWMVEEGSLCNLSGLEIRDCKRLKTVPDGLRFISTLEELKITNMSSEFQRRLRVVEGEEGADVYKIQHVPSIIFNPYIGFTPISLEAVWRLLNI